jgi:hypothetical protein
MAQPIRVVFRSRGGSLLRRASEEEVAANQQAQARIGKKWREDPGIRFICYYLSPGLGHHYIYEVDQISKVEEMNQDIWTSKELLIEDFSFEVVFGNTSVDDFYKA